MTRRFALISDLHANMEAVGAVMADIAAHGISEIHCLGDVVGYGPEPEAVCDVVRASCGIVLRGNHDDAVFGDARRFNPIAREAIAYTRARMRPGLLASKATSERWNWLSSLVGAAPLGEFLLVHGSPRDPVNEYVYREDVFLSPDGKLKEIFSGMQRVTFCGHTHMPVVIGSDNRAFIPKDGDNVFTFVPRMKYIVNVGSVGQPRDRDPRSSWVEVNGETVVFHRVAYDIPAVQRKIRAIPELSDMLARRLEEGV
ncbi:MAG: hypothetical protein RIS21_542 [Planctomycetota bacterium]|jgi:predicted phosphodiesterase